MSQKSTWAFEIERALGMDCGESTDHSRSVTNEPYIEFTSFGVFDNKGFGGWISSKEKAFEMLKREIAIYAWPKSFLTDERGLWYPGPFGKVYWRTLPELQEFKFVDADPASWKANDTHTGYNFYARLLVSDKPVLEKVA